MSTASRTLLQAPAEQAPSEASPAGRVFHGRSVAELIPRIQAELGPEAIVLRRRSGLEGGVGGFFQRPFVEIEARAGSGRVDFYDGEDAAPEMGGFAALELPGEAELWQAPEPAQAPALAPARTPAREPAPLASPTPAREPALGVRLLEDPRQGDVSAFANALAAAGIAISDTRTAQEKQMATPAAARPVPYSQLLSAYSAAPAEPPALPAHLDLGEPALPATAAPAASAPVPAPAAGTSPVPASATIAAPATVPSPVSASPARTRTQLGVVKELVATGMDESFALELIDAACAHVLVFNPRLGLRKAVRIELERRIPTAAPLPASGAAIVLAGPGGSGKTRCVATLAGIYRRSETLKISCASLLADGGDGMLKMILSPAITTPADATGARALRAISDARAQGLALIDTPSLSPADPAQIKTLGRLLGAVEPDRVVVALPATLGRVAAAQLLAAVKPLRPDALAITHADETDQIGVAVQTACESGLAPEYLLSGARGALGRLDPSTLAQRLLP